MKFRSMLMVLILPACVMLGGCGESVVDKSGLNASYEPGGMEVSIEGGDGQFPEFLVGKWKSDKHGWEFNFEPDGKISSAVVTMGRTRMEPGEIRQVPMKMGKKGEFTPGKWEVYYDYDIRELMVRIVIEHFYMEIADDVLEGKTEDLLVGNISEDETTWEVAWKSFPDYVAHFPDKPDFKMAADPEWGVDYTITFSKIVPEVEK
jgi:hypothetical protein